MKLDPKSIYLAHKLKWQIENYSHEIGINVTNPNFVISDLFYKGAKLQNPEYLYKFFSPASHNFESLENSYLYFGNPKDFNDAFDCVLSDDDYIKSFIDHQWLKDIGICNFSTRSSKEMWTYYTDRNRGFAIKFRNNRLFLPYGNDVSIKSHVLYLKENIPNHPRLIEALRSTEGKHFPEVVKMWQHQLLFQHDFCRKHNSFQWESEYRMITFSRKNLNRKIKFNPFTVESIYLGYKMAHEDVQRIKKILKNLNNVRVYKIHLNAKKQVLEEVRIKNVDSL